MQRSTKTLLFLFSAILLIQCKDETYYERPKELAAPIYQQLQSRGNFTQFLSCVDKAGYKNTLSGAGYFTAIAPNDDAFQQFYNDNNLSAESIDEELARKIVTYALVYNSFEKARLSDYQSNIGWQPLNAFKRRTAYYVGVYTDTTIDSRILKVTSSNRNGGYIFGDNNNKHIPYFISEYFAQKQLSAFDYNYFYPNTPFTGFNVADATVINADIIAENGTIHEVDKVILPLPNIDEYIDHKPEYSEFKNILEKYRVSYLTHPEVTNRYQVLTGSSESVYVKFYSFALALSPNNENFLKVADNDAQSDGWTTFVPTNEAVKDYVNNVLLKYYPSKSLDDVPLGVVNDFINAHLWQTTVWPSKFGGRLSFLGEEPRIDPSANVVEAKVLSNGIFYGTNKVQDADVFRSVFGEAYLNPTYSLMSRFMERELRSTIISPLTKFTLFLVPDDVLINAGHNYDLSTGEWIYDGSRNQSVVLANWSRMINMHVVGAPDGEKPLSGAGIIETAGAEFVKYNNNTVVSTGNIEENIIPNITGSISKHNGTVYFIDKLIRFPDNVPAKGLGFYIRDLGDQVGEPYQRFFDYLKNSFIYDAVTGNITSVSNGTFHTVFVPTNAAIQQAVTDGVLPSNINPPVTATLDREKIANFILYHILPGLSIIGNGKEEGNFESLYKPVSGDPTILIVNNKPGSGIFTVTDQKGRTATIVNGPGTNELANRTVIHSINNYLTY